MKTLQHSTSRKIMTRLLIAGALLTTFTALYADESRIAYEDPGKIKVVEGEQCGQQTPDGTDVFGNVYNPIALEGSMAMPDYYGSWDATVFLNGWRVRYLGDDQHVLDIRAAIGEIQMDGNMLRWEARGLLADDGFTEAYEFCYRYTAIAWALDSIRAVSDYNQLGNFLVNDDDQGNPASALGLGINSVDVPASLSTAAVGGNIIVLPSGISFSWDEDLSLSGAIDFYKDVFTLDWDGQTKEDHHLLQVAYNLDSVLRYSQESGFDPQRLHWGSQAIFKDNNTRRDFAAVESVNPIGGEDVYLIEPSFAISPEHAYASGLISTTGCVGAANEISSEDVVVENVPFDYAIPVLTGWDLHYGCGEDAHVQKIGIWVDNIQYDKDPDEATGTLRYRVSSVMRDNDLVPFHNARHKVSILGLNAGALQITYDGPRPGELSGVDDGSTASTADTTDATTSKSTTNTFR